MSDEKMMSRVSLAELEARAAALRHREGADEANQVMAYVELGRMLEVNVERCLVLIRAEQRLEKLEDICQGLTYDRDAVLAELADLRKDHAALQRMQDDLRARQDVVTAVMETGISKIEELARKTKMLTDEVADHD